VEDNLYLYCLAENRAEKDFKAIGLDGASVYSIKCGSLLSVVHNCPGPYIDGSDEVVKRRLVEHLAVVEEAVKTFGAVLPLKFNTVIKSENGKTSEDSMSLWITGEEAKLKTKLAGVLGKEEYGVQVLWNPRVVGDQLMKSNETLARLGDELKTKTVGLAYMCKQRIANILKKELELESRRCFDLFYSQIRATVADLRVEKNKIFENGNQMLLNLSCLLEKGKTGILGFVLEKIEAREGFSVSFTGPWPPFNFV
jgi:hypothetical protein